jgi:predicted amidohydrolase YtcJ
VLVGPPAVRRVDELRRVLRTAPGSGWIRAVGYHERVAGELDREVLDVLEDVRPVRVQHRSGAMWVLNSAACRAIGLSDDGAHPPGVELDELGRPNGRLHRLDDWLRARLPADAPPDVAGFGLQLARWGVTGVTDATPYRSIAELITLAHTGIVQRLHAMGGLELADSPRPPELGPAPVKVIVTDHELPALDVLVAGFRKAHEAGRPVAVHCVTRVGLVLALAAWDDAGSFEGDRIEHGSVVPVELMPAIAGHGLTVVTQPSFVAERGDDYLVDVDAEDKGDLYRCKSLQDATIAVAGSTDAPFGHPDPWRAITAAIERRTPAGVVLGGSEAVTGQDALDLFLGAPDAPGGPIRRVAVGRPADLVLLDRPLSAALAEPRSDHVIATFVGGDLVTAAP